VPQIQTRFAVDNPSHEAYGSKAPNPTMPEIIVYAIEGRTLEQKRGLVQDITTAMVKHFQVPAENVVVQIVETSKENKAKGGVLFSERPAPPR
jgi:4-oxalocrotonate tautomerase